MLEGVGAISKSESRQASSRDGDYQAVVAVPLGDEADDDSALPVGDELTEYETRPEDGIPHTLERVNVCPHVLLFGRAHTLQLRKIVRTVRVSPQRRSLWLCVVAESLRTAGTSVKPLMLILDVRTRWTSTHQMLRKLLHLFFSSWFIFL